MNRKERRKRNSGKPKPLRKPNAVAKSEVYSLTGSDGERLHLDVVAMRHWAEQHAEKVSISIEANYIERLLARGAITQERVKTILTNQDPKPVLLCRNINADGDEIVDGNHTYVALGFAWATAQRDGMMPADFQPRAKAYSLEPHQWRQFIIPLSMFATKPS